MPFNNAESKGPSLCSTMHNRGKKHTHAHTSGFVVPPTNSRSKKKLQAGSHKIWRQMQDLVTQQECRLCEVVPPVVIFIQGPRPEPCVELSTSSL